MEEYHKIQSIYMRDPATKHKGFLVGQYAMPEFEYLRNARWIFTEKIDGTNIRVAIDGKSAKFGGRTDNASIPAHLVEHLRAAFAPEILTAAALPPMVIYGEGYGKKIQPGGGDYLPDRAGFIIFDIRCGDYWLRRPDIEGIAARLNLSVVPVVGEGTLDDAERMCRDGFPSQLRATPPEGLVMRPAVELRTRGGDRIIAKLKLRDFVEAAA